MFAMAVVLLGTIGSLPLAHGDAGAHRVLPSLTGRPECLGDADEIVVCGDRERRPAPYRIDPSVLAAERAREAPPVDARSPQQKAVAISCHDLPSKCQGSGVIPLLPVALKAAEAALLAANKGEDWRSPFRTGPDEYQLHPQDKAKRARISIGLGASAKR